jgi:hypothetical protein
MEILTGTSLWLALKLHRNMIDRGTEMTLENTTLGIITARLAIFFYALNKYNNIK